MSRKISKRFPRLRVFRLNVALVVIAITTAVMPASAQPSVNEVYSDAKEIITELIEREVAESIATNLACHSRGGFLKYFPGTLQAIYERNFGALKEVLRREVIVMAGNFAFESFRQRRSIPLGEFLPASSFDPQKGDECSTAVRARGPAAYQEELARERRALGGVRYLPLDACSGVEEPNAKLELPCLFAQAVIASTSGRQADAAELLSNAIASTAANVLARYSSVDPARFRHIALDEVRARFTNGSFPADGLFATLAATDVIEAFELAQKPLTTILKNDSPNLRMRAGALRLLMHPAGGTDDTPEVLISEKAKEEPVPELVPYLKGLAREALPSAPGEGLGTAIARALLAQSGQVPKGQVLVTGTDRGAKIALSASAPVAFTGAGLARLQELHEMSRTSARLERLLRSALGVNGSLDEAMLRGIVGLIQAIDSLGAAMKNVGKAEDGGFDLMTLLDGVVRGKFADALCPKMPEQKPPKKPAGTPVKDLSACDVWKQATGLLDPEGQLRPILAAARDRNYRAIAVNSAAAIFSRAATEELCCGRDASCVETATIYGRLTKSFVSYVLMPRDDADASIAARAAFKSAAVDVIRSVGAQGGVERRISWRGVLLPVGSLRASWSSSYQQEDSDHNGVRYVPTVDWLTIRFPVSYSSSPVYAGGAISLVDGLAPFTELVARQSTLHYLDEVHVLATLVQPRVSAILAIPALTRHLALTLGGSLRGAAPFDLHRKDERERNVFGYSTIFGTPEVGEQYDLGRRFTQLFEVSAAVQYVP